MNYCDASSLVPLLVSEQGSDSSREWLGRDEPIVTWSWTRAEVTSAIERRTRGGSRWLVRVCPPSRVLQLASPPRCPSRIARLMVVAMPPKLGHVRSPGKARPARFARSGDRSRLS